MMSKWTRSLLKSNAKAALSGRYWRSFLLCLLLALVGVGSYSTSVRSTYDEMTSTIEQIQTGPVWRGDASTTEYLFDTLNSSPYASLVLTFGLAALAVFFVLDLALTFFVRVPLRIGCCRYFMESRQAPAPIATAVTTFRAPYLNIIKVQFLTSLKIFLGCLVIVPGIYWSYCYRQVPYLLAENPYLTTGRAMELSRNMMEGEKWRSFVLDLSFIGWGFLCTLTLGIGYLFLEPYYQATMAEFLLGTENRYSGIPTMRREMAAAGNFGGSVPERKRNTVLSQPL